MDEFEPLKNNLRYIVMYVQINHAMNITNDKTPT